MDHDWDDLTQYCKACGIARETVVDRNVGCAPGPNVIAVSHLIAQRRMNEILDVERLASQLVDKPCDTA